MKDTKYTLKIGIFHTPLHSTPPLAARRPRRNIAIPFGMEKETRMVWLPNGEKSLMMCITVSTEYVTDRQTDILRQHSLRYALHGIAR